MSRFSFDIHPKAREEFRRFCKAGENATSATMRGTGLCIGHLTKWVVSGIEEDHTYEWPDDDMALYLDGNKSVLIFLAQKDNSIVLMHVAAGGSDYDNEGARQEAIARTKEWFL